MIGSFIVADWRVRHSLSGTVDGSYIQRQTVERFTFAVKPYADYRFLIVARGATMKNSPFLKIALPPTGKATPGNCAELD